MPTAAATTKLNQLLNDLETGRIPVLDFLRGLKGTPEYKAGLGPHVQPAAAAAGAAAAPKGGFVRSGIVVRVKSVDPNGDNVIEGSVFPGAVQLTQRLHKGAWEQRVLQGTAELAIAGAKMTLKDGTAAEIPAGLPFHFANKGKSRWDFEARHPAWQPNTVTYEYLHQQLEGEDLFFEIKPAIDDRAQRPSYNIRSHDGGTYAVVMLEAGEQTLSCYYTDGDNTVTGLVGSGELTVGTKTSSVSRGSSENVPVKQPFRVANRGATPLLVEIRPTTPRTWDPQSSFWEVNPGKHLTGDKVYFEFVIPTP